MSNLGFVQQTNWLNSLFLTSHGQTPNSPRMSPPVVASSLPRWSDPGEAISAFFWVFEDGKMDETHICQCNSMDIWYKYVYIYVYILIDIWYMVNLREHIYTYLVLSAKTELESNEKHTQTINNWLFFFSDLKSNCIYLKPVELLPENLVSPWNLSFYPCPFWRSVGHVFLVGGPSIDMPFWRPGGLPGCQMTRQRSTKIWTIIDYYIMIWWSD
jgi:hypothetical protein